MSKIDPLAILRGKAPPRKPSNADAAKKAAAETAAALVRSGMRVGLGTGSTATHAIAAIGEGHARGELADIACMASSERSLVQAETLGLPILELGSSKLDICLDGADEVALGDDDEFWLIKGGGGAMLRERIVIDASDRFVCMVDISKCSPRLGTLFYLPVEVDAPESDAMIAALEQISSARAVLRTEGGEAYLTDNQNHIVDLHFGDEGIADARSLARSLNEHPSVKDHGLFLGCAESIVIADASQVEILEQADLQA